MQAEIAELGGVELILSQCQIDDASPLAREWGLWAVRNLCEGNEDIQARIQGLELRTAVQSEHLRKMGVQVELDKATGKLKMTQKEAAPAVSSVQPE